MGAGGVRQARGEAVSGLEARVRRADPDRFLCALFAPAARRRDLLLLYALNHELARAAEVTREPGLAMIRLAWWREVIAGERREHELAAPLGEAIGAGRLDRALLLALVEAREAELEAPSGVGEWLARLEAGPGTLAVAAGRVLGGDGAVLERLRALGAGYGGAGALRSVAFWAAQGRCLLPAAALAAAGLSADSVIERPGLVVARGVAEALAVPLRERLGTAAPLGGVVAAGLPAVLARRDLRAPARMRPRGIGDRARVLAAAMRGRA